MKKKSHAVVKKISSKTARETSSRKIPKPTFIIPGKIILGEGDIIALHGRPTIELTVSNTADWPIQVGSHGPFFEADRALTFDQEMSCGFHLQDPAGTRLS